MNGLKELFLDYVRKKEENFVDDLPTRVISIAVFIILTAWTYKKGAKGKGGLETKEVRWGDLEVCIIQALL